MSCSNPCSSTGLPCDRTALIAGRVAFSRIKRPPKREHSPPVLCYGRHFTDQAPVLLLFDIDGTLLEGTAPVVGEAMSAALREVHRVDTSLIRTQIPTAGRTDGEIARAILLDAGVSAARIDALADRVRDRCCEWSARLLPDDLSATVLPGVRELLSWLGEQPDVKLALLTGNYEPIARLKVTRAGIGVGVWSQPGRLRLRRRRTNRAARDREATRRHARVAVVSPSDDCDRRHTAGHPLRPRRRSALRGGGERIVQGRSALGCRRSRAQRRRATADLAGAGRRRLAGPALAPGFSRRPGG